MPRALTKSSPLQLQIYYDVRMSDEPNICTIHLLLRKFLLLILEKAKTMIKREEEATSRL